MAILPLWLSVASAFSLLLALVGRCVTGSVFGVLVDTRNRRSLSQLQVLIWSILILSATLAVALHYQTANVEMAPEMWALAGISVGSVFSSVTVKSAKMSRTAIPEAAGTSRGLLVVNSSPRKSRFTEMFMGEEIGDNDRVDIGKMQMFMISLTGWIAYGAALWAELPVLALDADGVARLPEISTTLVALLGISHAGYLSVKAVNKSGSAGSASSST